MRRPDFRSSAQKRLMPQLALKVPIFRRWNKRFFVAVDRTFYGELPTLKERSLGNSEITWLVYDFQRQAQGGFHASTTSHSHSLGRRPGSVEGGGGSGTRRSPSAANEGGRQTTKIQHIAGRC